MKLESAFEAPPRHRNEGVRLLGVPQIRIGGQHAHEHGEVALDDAPKDVEIDGIVSVDESIPHPIQDPARDPGCNTATPRHCDRQRGVSTRGQGTMLNFPVGISGSTGVSLGVLNPEFTYYEALTGPGGVVGESVWLLGGCGAEIVFNAEKEPVAAEVAISYGGGFEVHGYPMDTNAWALNLADFCAIWNAGE